jgi:hypothetical protein
LTSSGNTTATDFKEETKMSMYRQYEDPWKLEDQLAEAKQRLAENPYDEDLVNEVAELKDRVNFAWQDNEYENDQY